MFLEIKNLSKDFNGVTALENVSFSVKAAELVSIIGPSGSGKTTLLKIIAGLEKPDQGAVLKEDGSPVILVFQDYVLFPTMTVFENAAFGLRARNENKDQIIEKVNGILGRFGLDDKKRSYPNELSAGQKQRLAIARAMVLNPSILLLDEPFANLDKNLKGDMADFIRKTQRESGITIILVTHDLEEAFMTSDKIGILIAGKLCQYDSVQEIYHNPVTLEAGSFLGPVNIVPSEYFGILGLDKSLLKGKKEIYARAELFTLGKDENGPGIVKEVRFAGHYVIYYVSIENWVCVVYRVRGDIRVGDHVRLNLTHS